MHRHHSRGGWSVSTPVIPNEDETSLRHHRATETIDGIGVNRGMDHPRHLSDGNCGDRLFRSFRVDDYAVQVETQNGRHGHGIERESGGVAHEHK